MKSYRVRSMLITSLLVSGLTLDQAGVRVISDMPRGLPPLAEIARFDLDLVAKLATSGLAAVAIGRSASWRLKACPIPDGETGYSVKQRSDLTVGEVVGNQVTDCFPSVPKFTPTDVVVNIFQPLVGSNQTLKVGSDQPLLITLHGSSDAESALSNVVSTQPGYGSLNGAATHLTYMSLQAMLVK